MSLYSEPLVKIPGVGLANKVLRHLRASLAPFVLVLILAALLRVGLALVNRQANDDHMEVVAIMLDEGRVPTAADCFQCYHPKLFHTTVAYLIRGLGDQSAGHQAVSAQLVNSLAGTITLWYFARFIDQVGAQGTIALMAFGCVALNPKLVGIHAQATNDSFAILFSAMTIFALHSYVERGEDPCSLVDLASVAFPAAMTTVSKGSGLVLVSATVIVMALRTLGRWQMGKPIGSFVADIVFVLVMCGSVAVWFGPYLSNHEVLGSPIGVPQPRQPRPNLFQNTYVARPGITSIADSYLTFRLFGLLRTPEIGSSSDAYPLHRTSYWSQLYGRLNFVHFDSWPPTWRAPHPAVLHLGRVIFMLALVPAVLALIGFGLLSRRMVGGLWRHSFAHFGRTTDWMYVAIAACFMAMSLKLTFDMRDFSWMKAIYLFPALPCAAVAFVRGNQWLAWIGNKSLNVTVSMSMSVLMVLYVVEIVVLIVQLALA